MGQEVLAAAPSAALDLSFVSCPAGISVQSDGVQGSVNSPGFFHLPKKINSYFSSIMLNL